MTGNFRYIGISLGGQIQEFVLNKTKFVCLLRNSVWKRIIKLHIRLVLQNWNTCIYNTFLKLKIINDLQAILAENKIEQAVSGRKNNIDLLQKYEEQESK